MQLGGKSCLATHHPVPGHRRGRSVVNVGRLKDDFAAGRHRDSVAVGQRQRPIVVQHRVEILNPYGVDRAIQY